VASTAEICNAAVYHSIIRFAGNAGQQVLITFYWLYLADKHLLLRFNRRM
jgi:hypothetical protein